MDAEIVLKKEDIKSACKYAKEGKRKGKNTKQSLMK